MANFFAAELIGSGFAPLAAHDVRGVRCPTLLLNGEKSRPMFHRFTDRLQELLPHAERVEIPAASHISHEDTPPKYNAAVLSFLSRHAEPAEPRPPGWTASRLTSTTSGPARVMRTPIRALGTRPLLWLLCMGEEQKRGLEMWCLLARVRTARGDCSPYVSVG